MPKPIYLGIKLDGQLPGIAAIEFSISGIDPSDDDVLVDIQSITDPPALLYNGSWWAPSDTSQTGGIDIAWNTCILGTQPLFKLTLLWLSPTPPVNRELRVRHRYPPTNSLYGLSNPIAVDCTVPKPASPTYIAFRVWGGSYVLNPVVGVQGKQWGAVKGLYR